MAWIRAKDSSEAARLLSLALVSAHCPQTSWKADFLGGPTGWAGLAAVGWEWAQRPAVVAADTTAMALHTHLSAPVIRMRESVGFDPEGGAARDEAWSPSAPSF